jgi:alkaline phosphatase D
VEVTRRNVLRGGVLSAAAGGAVLVDQRPSAAATPLRSNPFTFGVASGDPAPDGFVIWTRLATRPMADDGHGGLSADRTVYWQVARDPHFTSIVRTGRFRAIRSWGHSVHVTLTGLAPGREYWYRFRQGSWRSRPGRAVTTPAYDANPVSLRISATSCANYADGWFTGYRRMAEDRPDLWLHLGDYIYEWGTRDGSVRDFRTGSCHDLSDYRRRYARYHTDPDLQLARATTPLVPVFDDHEVVNNWVSNHPAGGDPRFMTRRAAAFRACYENQPLRRTAAPVRADMRITRRIRWGQLATFHMLDTRQFRDDQPCGDGLKSCPDADNPAATVLGPAQEAWLAEGFRSSAARWDVLGQQIFFGARDADPGAERLSSMDSWDGYTAARRRLTQTWVDAGVRNPVVLSGDVHAAWGSDIRTDYSDPSTPVVGTEITSTSITSGKDGFDNDGSHPFMADNPHLRFYNNLRGYTILTFTPQTLTADYRTVGQISLPGAPVWTRASYVVEDRTPGLQLIAAHPSPIGSAERRRAPRDLAAATIAEETRTS